MLSSEIISMKKKFIYVKLIELIAEKRTHTQREIKRKLTINENAKSYLKSQNDGKIRYMFTLTLVILVIFNKQINLQYFL